MDKIAPDDWAIVYAAGFATLVGIMESLSGLTCAGPLLLFATAGCSSLNPRKAGLVWLIIGSSIPITYVLAQILHFPMATQPSWWTILLAPPILAFFGMIFGVWYGVMNEIARDY